MIVVTGANGFIGSMIVAELLQRHSKAEILGVDPVAMAERPEPLKNLKIRNLIRRDEIFEFFATRPQVDSIYHMGACSSTTETNKDFLTENNLEYSKKVFNWATELKVPLVYASSGAVYGDGKLGFSDTTDPQKLKPLNLYGWSKAEFDKWALAQMKTPPRWYGVRFFNVYGPHESHKGEMASVAYKAFNQIRNTGQLALFRSHNPQYKDGEQLRDFVYVKDVVNWMLQMIGSPKMPSGIYNLGFGKARTWLDLAREVFKNLNQEVNINWKDTPENIRSQYQYFTEADMKKSFAAGLSAPQWPLEKGIQDYIKNHLLGNYRE